MSVRVKVGDAIVKDPEHMCVVFSRFMVLFPGPFSRKNFVIVNGKESSSRQMHQPWHTAQPRINKHTFIIADIVSIYLSGLKI